MSYLEIKGVNKSYNDKPILKDINLSINKGSFTSLLGLSGSGKTTLLRIIAGLEQANTGSIFLNGKDITNLPTQLRNIGIVFQNYALFPHMNVFDNIAYGLKIKKYTKAQIQSKVAEVLEKVNLISKLEQQVSLLSGGEQQRVALARVIVTEPQIILLDEPLSNLDHSLRLQARNELKRLQNDIGITSIYVTHDKLEALALSDKIAVMEEGFVVQTGTPTDIYYHPINKFAAGLVGHYNIFDSSESLNYFNYQIPERSVLAILPEGLSFHKTTGNTNVIVKEILFQGALTEYILSANGNLLRAIVATKSQWEFTKGEHVLLSASKDNFKKICL